MTVTSVRQETADLLGLPVSSIARSVAIHRLQTETANEALAEMGERAIVSDNIDTLVAKVVKAAKPGDQILCMSNGGFGGIHDKLLKALA